MEVLIENVIFRKILEQFCRLLGIINQFIPKNEKKILFFNSKSVFLNNYSLYKFLIKNNYNEFYKIYYCMPGMNEIDERPKNVKYIEGSVKTVWLYLTSKYCFFDNGNMRIKPSKNQKVVNLWHGTPLKCIGFMSKSAEKTLPLNLMNTFTWICVATSNLDNVYIKSFNLRKNQILHCAQPRLDDFQNAKGSLEKMNIKKSSYNKIFMWMTTYRISKDGRLHHTEKKKWTDTNLPIIETIKDIDLLNSYLREENVFVIIKIHRTSIFDDKVKKEWSNIKLLTEEDFIPLNIQLYEILGECDALITDYSSVYFDYLILDRPICFIIKDFEEYERVNGFNIENPLDIMPGVHVTNEKQLKMYIKDVCLGKDDYADERKKVSSYFNEFVCESNSKKILDSIGLLKNK